MQGFFGDPYSVGHSGCLTACTVPPTSPQQLPALQGFTLGSSDPGLRPRGISERRLRDAARPGHTLRAARMGPFTVVPPCLLIFMYPFNAVY